MWDLKNVLVVAAIAIVAVMVYPRIARAISRPGDLGGSANQGAKDLALKRSLAGAKAVAEAGKAAIRGAATKASSDESKKVKQV